jgi:predicted MFS family arabinose efflux permease
MTATERRASVSLAAIFAMRMLGLFIVLPVFALEATRYPGGDDPIRVGLAMGIYGLTQAFLQIPLGLASDRWGRKRIILLGLSCFAAGSVLAALATTLDALIIGRALQGAGAVSAAVTAFLADVTRDQVRTKAMAMVGVSIALMFALSLILSPILNAHIGLSGLFWITTGLTVLAMALVAWVVPAEPETQQAPPRGSLRSVLRHIPLLRLNLGVFVLHAVQLAMWMAVPSLLVQAGLDKAHHWQVYLGAMLGSVLIMGGVLFRLERRGYLRQVFLFAIALILLVQLGFWFAASNGPTIALLTTGLFVFFLGFNTLEASQPSLVSRLAPPGARGAALGVYNTLQSMGFFVGGAVGGEILGHSGATGLFLACAGLSLLWLLAAWPMQTPVAHPPAH